MLHSIIAISAALHKVTEQKDCLVWRISCICNVLVSSQVAQARYMSSYMLTFALLRDSSDLHIYKDLYWERNKPEK